MPKYLDDFKTGDVMRFGAYAVTREECLEFAGDPQPFHLDDEAAAKSFFGRLSASGWLTGAAVIRMINDNWQAIDCVPLGSPGIDAIRWPRPVYPGDVLRVESEFLEITFSRSKPDRGTARIRTTAFNQFDQPVMTLDGMQFMARRPA